MPVPAIGMKKLLLKAMLPHNRASVCCMTKVMVCRKTMSAPATGMKKPRLKAMLLPKPTLASCMQRVMACRKTMPVPATGLRKLPLKGTAPPNLHCACGNGKDTSLPRQAT